MNPPYRIVEVTAENLDEVGLYCSRSKHKEDGYRNKLEWIRERFRDGLEYHVLNVDEGRKDMAYRGMIEYMPAEKCWRGIDAPDYMAIHCLWVVGRHKKKGYGTMLLQRCIDSARAKDMHGVVAITVQKGGWMPTKKIYENQRFKQVDEMEPGFSLYALKFSEDFPDPKFCPSNPEMFTKYGEGITVLTSHQCPYMAGTLDGLREYAEKHGEKLKIIEMKDPSEAQLCGNPYGTFLVIRNGEYVTHLPGGQGFIKKEMSKKIQ